MAPHVRLRAPHVRPGAFFPANLNMAVNADRFRLVPEPLLWARLPLQGALIAWVLR